MKIRAKSLFRSLVFLLVLAYAAAHVLVRTEFGRRHALRCLSDASGLSVSAEKVRLTAGLSLRLGGVVARAGAADGAPVVFSAPELRLSKRCRGVRATADGATIRAVRPADGTDLPAALAGLADATPGIAAFGQVSRAFGPLFFRLSGATLELGTGPSASVFSSLDWTRRPVCLEGHPEAVQNRLSYGTGPVWQPGESGVLSDGRRAEDEWFELADAVVRFSGAGYTTGPSVVGRVLVPVPAESSAAPEPAPEAAPDPAPAPVEAPAAPEPPASDPAPLEAVPSVSSVPSVPSAAPAPAAED